MDGSVLERPLKKIEFLKIKKKQSLSREMKFKKKEKIKKKIDFQN